MVAICSRVVNWGGILADDMGLGKPCKHSLFCCRKNSGRLHQPALVVAPTSVIYNWQREAQRFTPTLKLRSIARPGPLEILQEQPTADIYVTSYALVYRDLAVWQNQRLSYLVLDEAHHDQECQYQGRQGAATISGRTPLLSYRHPARKPSWRTVVAV